jgi:predicted ABC-type ATPase
MSQPKVIIIAGPNGAGKTTFAREYLPREGACTTFINADLIAAGLSPFAPAKAAIQAGRLMIESIGAHVAQRQSFALETTLSGVGYARQIAAWRREGYGVELQFLSLPAVETAIKRVAERVRQGGHDIPELVIRRRYHAGLRLFESTYKSLVDEWTLYDSSGELPMMIDCSDSKRGTDGVTEPQVRYGAEPPLHANARQLGALAAMRRAAQRAREIARQTGTDLILVRDGKVVHVKPSEEPSAS